MAVFFAPLPLNFCVVFHLSAWAGVAGACVACTVGVVTLVVGAAASPQAVTKSARKRMMQSNRFFMIRTFLQKFTTLWKFPGVFIFLTNIAMRTGQDKIANIIGWNVAPCNTAQGKRVIDVVHMFAVALLKLGMTARRIVAAVLLAFEQVLNLCSGMGSLNKLLKSAASMFTNTT